jgi:hypothetical protein
MPMPFSAIRGDRGIRLRLMRGRHKSDPAGVGRIAYVVVVALVALVLVVIGVLAVTSVL